MCVGDGVGVPAGVCPEKRSWRIREDLKSHTTVSSFCIHSVMAFVLLALWASKNIAEAQLCHCCQILCSSLTVVIMEQGGLGQV